MHQKEKFWQCEDCDYKTNNQVGQEHKLNLSEIRCASKNIRTTNMRERIATMFTVLTAWHFDKRMRVYWGKKNGLIPKIIYNSPPPRCVCTWCPFKSSKYSVVKKHIEIHHERKHHYPCKECVFVGQSVDDYAEHYHTFHKVSAFVNYNLVSRHHKVQGACFSKLNTLPLIGSLF